MISQIVLCTAVCMISLVAGQAVLSVKSGDDWSLPKWYNASKYGGFYSYSPVPQYNISVGVVDITWAQLNPAPGVYRTDLESPTGAEGMYPFPSFDEYNQTYANGFFWMRLWASAEEWAPAWLPAYCNISYIGIDYDNNHQLPVWNACYFAQLMKLYRWFFIQKGLRADPRFKFLYIPGAFTYVEYDFDMINSAHDNYGLTWPVYYNWTTYSWKEIVSVFNGDNNNPNDDYSFKVIYTGEDYPYGPADWPEHEWYVARDAVAAGTGVRTGITEIFNHHLSEVYAYGVTIDSNGYLIPNNTWDIRRNLNRIMATENECYNDCGYSAGNYTQYAVYLSNLKALQMGMNWIYVDPDTSYLGPYQDFYNWVRLSLGRSANSSADAWAILRDAQDLFWDSPSNQSPPNYKLKWNGMPYIKNLERYLTQRDVKPDGVTSRGSVIIENVIDPANGRSYEGRRTNITTGQNYLYFDLDNEYIASFAGFGVEIKVTYLDSGRNSWNIQYNTINFQGEETLTSTNSVTNTNSGQRKTATFSVHPNADFDNKVNGMDFRIYNGGKADLEVYFVRVVKELGLQPSSGVKMSASVVGLLAMMLLVIFAL